MIHRMGHDHGRPPKAKNPLGATVKKAMAVMPKAHSRPPKKARTIVEGATPSLAPKPALTPAPTPIGNGSAIKARKRR